VSVFLDIFYVVCASSSQSFVVEKALLWSHLCYKQQVLGKETQNNSTVHSWNECHSCVCI